jgi:hypothetical protein
MFLFNIANVIGGKNNFFIFYKKNIQVSQRYEKYTPNEPVEVKTTTKTTTTTTTTPNAQSKKTAPPAPPAPPADSDRGSVEFFEFTGES